MDTFRVERGRDLVEAGDVGLDEVACVCVSLLDEAVVRNQEHDLERLTPEVGLQTRGHVVIWSRRKDLLPGPRSRLKERAEHRVVVAAPRRADALEGSLERGRIRGQVLGLPVDEVGLPLGRGLCLSVGVVAILRETEAKVYPLIDES